jgi:hypothetical protein
MSEHSALTQSWLDTYYPETAEACVERNPGKVELTAHSLRKWKGLRPEVLSKHGLKLERRSVRDIKTDLLLLVVSSSSCALCRAFIRDNRIPCALCPLYVTLDSSCAASCNSPYGVFVKRGDPEPMIKALKETLELAKREKV